jgi:pimeloyl-ACP methyl ester carboxylesterase
LKLDQINAIGASAGGTTLIHANCMQPDRFKSVITIGAQLFISKSTRDFITRNGPDSTKAGLMEYMATLHGPLKAMLLARQIWHLRNAYGDPAFTPDMLHTITANWLIVHGDNDKNIPVDHAYLHSAQSVMDLSGWRSPSWAPTSFRRNELC